MGPRVIVFVDAEFSFDTCITTCFAEIKIEEPILYETEGVIIWWTNPSTGMSVACVLCYCCKSLIDFYKFDVDEIKASGEANIEKIIEIMLRARWRSLSASGCIGRITDEIQLEDGYFVHRIYACLRCKSVEETEDVTEIRLIRFIIGHRKRVTSLLCPCFSQLIYGKLSNLTWGCV